jgi:hypothetical protein
MAPILLDKQNQSFVDALEAGGGPPLQTLPILEARGILEQFPNMNQPQILQWRGLKFLLEA